MPAVDGVLFIDANAYLDLFQLNTVKTLLASLTEQADHIFVTEQVVNEVERNKVRVTERSLTEKLKKLEGGSVSVAGHFLTDADEAPEKLRLQLREIRDKIKEVNGALVPHGINILKHVSRSEDGISKALEPIFANAVPHKPGEIQRARERKERGFPPGKSEDPLGDELNWEQILTACKGKTRLWIVTNDFDFIVEYGGECFLNAALHQEVLRVLAHPREVFCFNKIERAIEHFAKINNMIGVKLPSPAEAAEIEKEREQLPLPEWIPPRRHLPTTGWMSNGSDSATFIAIANAHRRRDAMTAIMASGSFTPIPPPELLNPGAYLDSNRPPDASNQEMIDSSQ